MTKINEGASWLVERIVPAMWVVPLLSLLNPLEDLKDAFERDLTVRQRDIFHALLFPLVSANVL